MALRRDLHVLVVDDTAVSRQILRQMLERFGVGRVDTAVDAAEAHGALSGRGADLVICDLNLPGEDGVDLLHWLRGRPRTSRVGYILTSAMDHVPRLAEAERLGIDALLTKPFRAEDLLTALEDIAGRI